MTTQATAEPARAVTRKATERAARKRRPPRTLYRGDPAMWSWVLHRISGATIFFFLFVHVLGQAVLRVSPQAYDSVIHDYQSPVVGLMEFGLVAAVLFHALNGIRVILIDFWSEGTRYQRQMLWVVAVVFLLLLVPSGVVLGIHLTGHLSEHLR